MHLRVRASRRASASSCAMCASARRLSAVNTSRLADTYGSVYERLRAVPQHDWVPQICHFRSMFVGRTSHAHRHSNELKRSGVDMLCGNVPGHRRAARAGTLPAARAPALPSSRSPGRAAPGSMRGCQRARKDDLPSVLLPHPLQPESILESNVSTAAGRGALFYITLGC